MSHLSTFRARLGAIALLAAVCGCSLVAHNSAAARMGDVVVTADTGSVEIQAGTSVNRDRDLQSIRLPATAFFRLTHRPDISVPAGHPMGLDDLRAVRRTQVAVRGPTGVYWVDSARVTRTTAALRLPATDAAKRALYQGVQAAIARERARACGTKDVQKGAAFLAIAEDVGILRALDDSHLDPEAYASIAPVGESGALEAAESVDVGGASSMGGTSPRRGSDVCRGIARDR